jgi:hypothetical protein
MLLGGHAAWGKGGCDHQYIASPFPQSGAGRGTLLARPSGGVGMGAGAGAGVNGAAGVVWAGEG